MAHEYRHPDMQIAAVALRQVIANGGTMDIDRMAQMTKACKELGDMPLKNARVGAIESENRAKEAKVIEASKLKNAVTREIEAHFEVGEATAVA